LSQLEKIKDKIEEKITEVKEKAVEILSFNDIVRIWKGTQDSQERAKIILDPSNPQTSTKLSSGQVDFVAISYNITDYFPEFKGLTDFAKQFVLSSMSKDGFGVTSAIQYEQAVGEKRLMQLGLKSEGKENVKS